MAGLRIFLDRLIESCLRLGIRRRAPALRHLPNPDPSSCRWCPSWFRPWLCSDRESAFWVVTPRSARVARTH